MYRQIDNYDVENKELDNVIFVICHMYTFKVLLSSIRFRWLY